MKRALALLLLITPCLAGAIPTAERQSGYTGMAADTRALQDNDRANPAMLWVQQGDREWNLPAGDGMRSCAGCHGDLQKSMAGVAARYPAFDIVSGKARDLTGQIQYCRTENQKQPPYPAESRPLLSLLTAIGLQSRGAPIKPPSDLRLDVFQRAGERLFNQRIGQLNLSCAQCHDDNWGKRLGASVIPQAHPTAYPIYRLEWQTVGSLQRRLRNCMIGVRAEPYPYGAQELVDIELYLMTRAAGMPLETPGVRP